MYEQVSDLENNRADSIPDSSSESKTKNRNRLLTAIAAIVVVGIVVGAFLVSGFLAKPINEDSWLFKGAYARYEGSTAVMGFGFNFSMKLEVLDYNSTRSYVDIIQNGIKHWRDCRRRELHMG